jgi:hypothetical protein
MTKTLYSVSIGQRFGRLTVISERYSKDVSTPLKRRTRNVCDCKCDCGGLKTVGLYNLVNEIAQSCGCINRTHGQTPKGKPTPTYRSWYSMIERCSNPNTAHYDRYGGRGITVCQRWLAGEGDLGPLECFIHDMGIRPIGMTLERRDNDKPYCKENCCWATRLEQARNRSTTNFHLHKGREMTLREIAEMEGITYERLRHRVTRANWPLELAVSHPSAQGSRVGKWAH